MTASGNIIRGRLKDLLKKGEPAGFRKIRKNSYLRRLMMAVLFIIFVLFPAKAFASGQDELQLNETYTAELIEYIDGDSARFKIGKCL